LKEIKMMCIIMFLRRFEKQRLSKTLTGVMLWWLYICLVVVRLAFDSLVESDQKVGIHKITASLLDV